MATNLEPNDQFLRLFEAIKDLVNTIAGRTSYELQLDAACNCSRRVTERRSEIRHVREVRNVIAHPQAKSGAPAVIVTPDLLARTQRLLNDLSLVRTANTTGVPRGQLFTATPDTRLTNIAETMRTKRYTHVPVLDEGSRVIGVFNESAIFDYLVSQTIIELDDAMLVDDIMDHCRLDAGHTESFRFIRPSTTEDEMLDALINVEGEFTRVGALFVTPSGNPNEPLHRMITIWDVMSKGT